MYDKIVAAWLCQLAAGVLWVLLAVWICIPLLMALLQLKQMWKRRNGASSLHMRFSAKCPCCSKNLEVDVEGKTVQFLSHPSVEQRKTPPMPLHPMASLLPLLLALMCVPARAQESTLLWTNKQVFANSTNYTGAVDVRRYDASKGFSLYWNASALSNLYASAVALEVSPDGTNYFATNIVTAFSNVSGRASNGKDLYVLSSFVAPWLRIRAIVTTTNTAPTGTVGGITARLQGYKR